MKKWNENNDISTDFEANKTVIGYWISVDTHKKKNDVINVGTKYIR